jgi:hypothetical protein
VSEIRLPFRSRSDPLSSVGELARHIESPDESATVRELVTDAAGAGLTTVGQLLDHIEALGPRERRTMLDQARTRAGLPTATALASKSAYDEQSRQMFVAAADDVELRFASARLAGSTSTRRRSRPHRRAPSRSATRSKRHDVAPHARPS